MTVEQIVFVLQTSQNVGSLTSLSLSFCPSVAVLLIFMYVADPGEGPGGVPLIF